MQKFIRIPHGESALDGILSVPDGAQVLFVMAHGAGAGMRHEFLEDIALRLYKAGVATLRFQFPYMQAGRRLPDKEPVLLSALEDVWEWVARELPSVRLVAGGKSMGGRMSSKLVSLKPRVSIDRLIFLGFPLHPAKKKERKRADHLQDIKIKMLFLQGTRDALSDSSLMNPVGNELGERARLHWIEAADHGFDVLKKSGRSTDDVRKEIVEQIVLFCGNRS